MNWTIAEAIAWTFTLNLFQPNQDNRIPIPHYWDRDDKSNLYLVLGPNGSGKSFFRRLLGRVIRDQTECQDVLASSMEGRTSEQSHRFLTYGFEENQSTGLNSVATAISVIRAAQLRTKPHVVMFDEPDIGLDQEGCAGLGACLREFVENPPTNTRAVFVSSHSPILVRELAELDHNYIHLGLTNGAPETVWDWIDRPIEARSPEMLRQIGTTRYALIEDVLQPRFDEPEED